MLSSSETHYVFCVYCMLSSVFVTKLQLASKHDPSEQTNELEINAIVQEKKKHPNLP